MTPRRKSWLRLALLVLLAGLGCTACGDDESPTPAPGGSGGGDASPYGPDGALLDGRPGATKRPNLLFVVCEELRAREAAEVAPDSPFAGRKEDVAVFDAAVTPRPEAGAALASLLTGCLPSRHRVSHLDPVARLAPGFVTLPEVLRAQGYATRAFVARDRLRRSSSLWQGCDVEPARVGASDAAATISRWIATVPTGTPWLALLVVDDIAPPYGKRARGAGTVPLGRRLSEPNLAEAYFTNASAYDLLLERARSDGVGAAAEWERRLRYILWNPAGSGTPMGFKDRLSSRAQTAYREEVAWALDLLAEVGRPLGDAVALYTSTGGTSLGEDDVFGAGRSLADVHVRIPFVLDGVLPHGRVKDCVSLVDVLPTVLAMLELPELPDVDGVSLLPVMRGEVRRPPVVSEEHQDAENTGDPSVSANFVSVRTDRWKYMVRFDLRAGTVVEWAYDLGVDSEEKANLANERGTVEGVPFDPEMCAAIERVRDGIWGQVQGANATANTPYAMGARVTTGRPAPCGK